MATKVGFECVLYRNTGTYGSPVWNEVSNVRDLTLTLTKDKVDASTRGTASDGAAKRFKEYRAVMKDAPVTIESLWNTDDADLDAFFQAWLNDTAIEVLILDGPVTTAGSEGLRATMEVFKFDRGEPLNDMVKASVELAPSALAANKPQWYIAT